jgi:hypothetical protein
MAAARFRTLLTAYATRPHLATASDLLSVDDDFFYWLSVARLYPVLGTLLPRLGRAKHLGQSTEFDALGALEIAALAEGLDFERCQLRPLDVPVPPRRYGVLVLRAGRVELETPGSIATLVDVDADRSGRLMLALMQRRDIEPEEWSARVQLVAAAVNSNAVQCAIGEGQGVRATANHILAGLTGASSATVRRRSQDIAKLIPSKFTWECRPGR